MSTTDIKDEKISKNSNDLEDTTKKVPKLKRFDNHELAFEYFLKMIYWDSKNINNSNKINFGRKQRSWLKELLSITLSRMLWCCNITDCADDYKVWVEIPNIPEAISEIKKEYPHAEIVHRNTFTEEDYDNILGWELIDYHVRLIISKESYLSKSLREFVLEIFNWVNHFVAAKGEGATISVVDLNNMESTKEIIENAQKIFKKYQDKT